MPDDQELMRIHAATLFTHDPSGMLLRVNEPRGGEAPRFFLGRTARGRVLRFRHDVDEALARELEAACAVEPVGDEFLAPPYGSPPYEALLSRSAPIQRQWAGPAYCFPDELPASAGAVPITAENADLLRPHLEPWLDDVALDRPAAAFVRDGRAVSVCFSVRITDGAEEAGVETAPEYRGHGYAAPAVAAWARGVRDRGRIPLYSTSWENTASQALARRLGLRRYGTDLHIT